MSHVACMPTSYWYFRVTAFEKKATGENHRILDRDSEGVFQRRQLQFSDGHHRRA